MLLLAGLVATGPVAGALPHSGAAASLSSAWVTTTRAETPASLAPAATADAEPTAPPLFDLSDVVLVDTADADEEHFTLGPLTLVDLNLLRGPPPSYPETRVGGFALLPPFRVGASPTLSLWGRQACGFVCREVASDSRYDPWGLCAFGLPCRAIGTAAADAIDEEIADAARLNGDQTGIPALTESVLASPLTATLRTGESTGGFIEYVRQQAHEPLIETNPAKAKARVTEGMLLFAGTLGDVAVVGGVVRSGLSALRSGFQALRGFSARLGEAADEYLPVVYDEGVFGMGGSGLGKIGKRRGLESVPAAPGVYHVETATEKYTGSGVNVRARLSTPDHPAADLLEDPSRKLTVFPADISGAPQTLSGTNRALRVVEQDVMNRTGNVPKVGGSRNRSLALRLKKHEPYRELYRPTLGDPEKH